MIWYNICMNFKNAIDLLVANRLLAKCCQENMSRREWSKELTSCPVSNSSHPYGASIDITTHMIPKSRPITFNCCTRYADDTGIGFSVLGSNLMEKVQEKNTRKLYKFFLHALGVKPKYAVRYSPKKDVSINSFRDWGLSVGRRRLP